MGTFGLVCLTWVFFRAHSFADALRLLRAMLIGAPDTLSLGVFATASVVVVTALLLAAHWWMRDSSLEARWQQLSVWGRSAILATLILSIALVPGDDRAFIYFQF